MADQFDELMNRNVHPAPAPVPAVPLNVSDDAAAASDTPAWSSFSVHDVPSDGTDIADVSADVGEAAALPIRALDSSEEEATPELLQPLPLPVTGSDDTSVEAPLPFNLDVSADEAATPPTLIEDEAYEIDLFPIESKAVVLADGDPRVALGGLIGDYAPAQWIDGALRDLTAAGVSDVHLNRNGSTKVLSIEARIDGVLEVVKTFGEADAKTVVNTLKTRAEITTTTNVVPEDGRVILPVNGFPYRVRAVSLPGFDGGEKIVLRLPSVGELKALDDLGASEENLTAIRYLLAQPNGMLLIAGPVGEGKTSTAHIALKEIGTVGKATITIEDPVERVLEGVHQIEVNADVGAGFGDIMKYVLRADFDTLFIGEIRDAETAAAAVRLAKAGRRVIATVHATNNINAMLRLIELSEDTPLSVLDAMSGVISQRLVKKVDRQFGGYRGRHAVHEVLVITDEFADHLIEGTSPTAIREAATKSSTTFEDNLKWLVDTGITDQAEARRVVGHDV